MIRPMTPEQRARIDGSTCVVSCSTGKDSVAVSLWLTENGVEHERIFLDTHWEHPAVAEHLEYLCEKLGPITVLSGRLGMVDLIRKKGMFPRMGRDGMSTRRKVGDWVRVAIGAGFRGNGLHRAEIMPGSSCGCFMCFDPHCLEWSTLLIEPDTSGHRVMVCHVSECEMGDDHA